MVSLFDGRIYWEAQKSILTGINEADGDCVVNCDLLRVKWICADGSAKYEK